MTGSPRHFLLIDDDVVFNFIHTEAIKRLVEDAVVDSFNSPQEALEHIKALVDSKQPLPDFVFLDIRMPELDGFEFLQEMEKMNPGTFEQVIIYMLTSSLDDRDRMKALNSPLVKGFKNKPLTESKLLEILEEVKRK